MSNRTQIRYLLRTCWGPLAAVAAAVFEIYNFLRQGQPWRGEVIWAIDWSGTALIVVGPVIAGVAAVDSGRLAGGNASYLVDSGRNTSRAFLMPWLASFIPVAFAHLLVSVLYIWKAVSPNAPIPVGEIALAIASQMVGFAFYAAIGSVIGRLFGPIVGAVVSAVGCIVTFFILGTSGEKLSLLQFGRASASLIGFRMSPVFIGTQVLVLSAAVILLLTVPTLPGIKTRKLTILGALILASMVAALTVVSQTPAERFVSTTAIPSVCGGEQPSICVYPEHTRFMPYLLMQTSAVFQASDALGVRKYLPDHYVERLPSESPSTDGNGRISIPLEAYGRESLTGPEVAREMIFPYHCKALYGDTPPPIDFGDHLELAANALASRAGLLPGDNQSIDQAKVGKILASFHDCTLGQLR